MAFEFLTPTTADGGSDPVVNPFTPEDALAAALTES